MLDALLVVSDDRFSVIGTDADDQAQVQVGFGTRFAKLRLLSREELGRGWRNEATVIVGPDRQSVKLAPDGVAVESNLTVGVREEVFLDATGGIGLRAGIDVQAGEARFEYDLPRFGEREAAILTRLAPAAYLEPTVRLGPLSVVPGVRLDALTLGDVYRAWTVDPRAAARLELGPATLKASVGGYSQWPTPRQAVEVPDLGAARAWQTAAGIEQQLSPDLSVEINAYRSALTDLVSGREDAFRFFSGPPPVGPLDTGPYANDGTGLICGAEVLLRWQTDRTTAWIAATVSRSTRIDRPGEKTALFEYDQPLVLTALASHQLPRRWRLGARARLSSGNPYTPVVNRVQSFDQRIFLPVYGALDSARIPPFWQLDVRVDKDWVFRKWQLTAYLDLQNATNAQNVEVMSWTYDYAEEEPILQTPLVPRIRAARRVVRAAGIAVGALACMGPVDETRIEELRLLAMAANPPVVEPGEPFDLELTIADPLRERGEVVVWSCGPQCEATTLPIDGPTLTVPWRSYAPVPVWAMACAPGACGDLEQIPKDRLADPTGWLQTLPVSGVSAGFRSPPLAPEDGPWPVNPEWTEAPDPWVEPAPETPLRFVAPGAQTAYGYTTRGGFDAAQYDVSDSGAVTLTWLPDGGAPAADLFVVLEDGLGGVSVWTGSTSAR